MKIGLALGGGSARGLAHITVLQAFDDLGVKPVIMSGCSMGALVGAAYASGISAKDIAEHACSVLDNRIEAVRHIFTANKGNLFDLLNFKGLGAVHVDGKHLADLVMPKGTAERVEDTSIPFKVVATDFYNQEQHVFVTGDMAEVVAASIAIPGVISAPEINGRLFVDGGMTNPVPFDLIRDEADFVVAVDVTGRPIRQPEKHPSNIELATGAMLTMFRQIAVIRRELAPPDVYIEPNVEDFGAGDFFSIREILHAARPARDELKRALEAHINAVS